MPRSAPYDDLLMEMLKDEERAIAYLNAALDEQDPRVFLLALRNVTQALGGIAKVAAHSCLNRESLISGPLQKRQPGRANLGRGPGGTRGPVERSKHNAEDVVV